MSKILTLECPAKLNLTLEVLSKKADGMHEIESHFQLINLYDYISIKETKNEFSSIKTNALIDIDNEKNIVYKAIDVLNNHINKDICCDISIEKNIPIGGGLGGGSSNAAAVLIGINSIFSLKLSMAELMNIGSKIGADVPFFIFGKNALAKGVGNKLEVIKCDSKKFLIISPNIHSSTRDMFLKWDSLNEQKLLSSLPKNKNAFLEIFLIQKPEIREIYEKLLKTYPVMLSGTGSTFFCTYNDEIEIKKTLKKIPTKWRHFFCEPLQCSPLLKYIT